MRMDAHPNEKECNLNAGYGLPYVPEQIHLFLKKSTLGVTMEINDIRALADVMRDTGLSSLEYSGNGVVIKLTRESATAPHEHALTGSAVHLHAPAAHASPAAAPPDGSYTVTSPMVGVFYAAPGEDQEPFVKIGDEIKPGDILCIVEAMKMMNEIAAEKGGVITEVCVSNKQVVEFGTPLFKVKQL